MPIELSQNVILMTAAAFLLGWLLASISARFGSKTGTTERDPRESRIRSLEAELRVARSDADTAREKLETIEKSLEEATEGIEKRDNVIAHQQKQVDELKQDLKDSVLKTRELRAELSDRATQSVRSEAKLREVETELSVAQASTDLLATGVLDYSVASDSENRDTDDDAVQNGDHSKAAT